MRDVRGTTAVIISVCALTGCGGGSSSDDTVPSALVGTYTTTLAQSDIPADAPAYFEAGPWELVIATSGAPDGGPALAINHPTKGNLEAPGLTVDGDRFILEQEECGGIGASTTTTFHDNEYSWRLDGSTLRLTTEKNDCPDHVAETILTSSGWTKQP
jgi:hypothetical protein